MKGFLRGLLVLMAVVLLPSILTCGQDGMALPITPETAGDLALVTEYPVDIGEISGIHWHPNQSVIYVSGSGGTGILAPEVLLDRYQYPTYFGNLMFSPDGGTIVGGTTVWDVETGEVVRDFASSLSGVSASALSSEGNLYAVGHTCYGTGCAEHSVEVWDTHNGELLHELGRDLNGIVGLAFSPDGTMLAAASRDAGSISVWDLANGEDIVALYMNPPGSTLPVVVAFSLDGTALLAAGEMGDGLLLAWDTATWEQNAAYELMDRFHWGYYPTFSPDGSLLVNGNLFEGYIYIWDVASGELLNRLPTGGTPSSFAFSPDSTMLAIGVTNWLSAGVDWDLQLWSVQTSAEITTVDTCTFQVSRILTLFGEPDSDAFLDEIEVTNMDIEVDGQYFDDSGSLWYHRTDGTWILMDRVTLVEDLPRDCLRLPEIPPQGPVDNAPEAPTPSETDSESGCIFTEVVVARFRQPSEATFVDDGEIPEIEFDGRFVDEFGRLWYRDTEELWTMADLLAGRDFPSECDDLPEVTP